MVSPPRPPLSWEMDAGTVVSFCALLRRSPPSVQTDILALGGLILYPHVPLGTGGFDLLRARSRRLVLSDSIGRTALPSLVQLSLLTEVEKIKSQFQTY